MIEDCFDTPIFHFSWQSVSACEDERDSVRLCSAYLSACLLLCGIIRLQRHCLWVTICVHVAHTDTLTYTCANITALQYSFPFDVWSFISKTFDKYNMCQKKKSFICLKCSINYIEPFLALVIIIYYSLHFLLLLIRSNLYYII